MCRRQGRPRLPDMAHPEPAAKRAHRGSPMQPCMQHRDARGASCTHPRARPSIHPSIHAPTHPRCSAPGSTPGASGRHTRCPRCGAARRRRIPGAAPSAARTTPRCAGLGRAPRRWQGPSRTAWLARRRRCKGRPRRARASRGSTPHAARTCRRLRAGGSGVRGSARWAGSSRQQGLGSGRAQRQQAAR